MNWGFNWRSFALTRFSSCRGSIVRRIFFFKGVGGLWRQERKLGGNPGWAGRAAEEAAQFGK